MWISANRIRFKSFWQDPSYQRLALALGLSLFLHLFLIGKFNFNLPDANEKRHLIEARLILPKALPRPIQKLPVENKPAVKSAELKEPVKVNEPPPPETKIQPELVPTTQIEQLRPSDIVEPVTQSEVAEPVVENQIEENGLIINPHPYQYVDSEFDVYTEKETVLNRPPAGNAKIIYQRLPNGEQYQIKSLIQARGLISLVIPDLLQTSEGYLDGVGLQPAHYLYQFGNRKDKTFHADFDWESKKLSLRSEKGEEKVELHEGTQDLLSFMYQFMFIPPLQNMQLSITNGKKLGVYDYRFEGEEIITTKMGDLNTVHLLRMAEEGEKKTELWLALDYQYVPVKIRETDKAGKVYELLVTSLKTEQPAISQ